jgi:hypothetical protein
VSGKRVLDGSRRWFLQATTGAGIALINGPAAADPRTREEHVWNETTTTWIDRPNVRSPRHLLDSADRSAIVDAVRCSLENFIAAGVDNIFPAPFEIERVAHDYALRDRISALAVNYFISSGCGDGYESFHSMIVPKANRYGYRRCSHFDLLEAVIYLSCAILIGNFLEPARLPGRARQVFSYRFRPDSTCLFDERNDYDSFNAHVASKLDENDRIFLVSADIADFFPNIEEDRLLNNLHRCGTPDWLLESLAFLLQRWRGRGGDGLPIGPNASFVLAEGALLNVDNNLQRCGVDFARYVDDYRLFAPNVTTARQWLEQLVTELASEGLRLNSAKSSFEAVTRTEYEALAIAKRTKRMWGDLSVQFVQNSTNAATQPIQVGTNNSSPKKQDNKKKNKDNSPLLYEDMSPFQKRKQSQLNDRDFALLETVDTDQLLLRMRQLASRQLCVPPGEFCLFAEASCHRREHFKLADLFDFLDRCPHCISYLIDVLIEEREVVPVRAREIATTWFASRLSSRACISDYELLHVARLLGTQGYEDPDSVFSYLQSMEVTCCPIVIRAFLFALRGHCDETRARFLLSQFAGADVFTHRAVVDLVWSEIAESRRATILDPYRAGFNSDPFLETYAARMDSLSQTHGENFDVSSL